MPKSQAVMCPPAVRDHQHRSGLNITAHVEAEGTGTYLKVSKFRNSDRNQWRELK
jgi:hypothetical protein